MSNRVLPFPPRSFYFSCLMLRPPFFFFFFLKTPPPPKFSPFPLHAALPIFDEVGGLVHLANPPRQVGGVDRDAVAAPARSGVEGLEPERLGGRGVDDLPHVHVEPVARSEEHTSELQSQSNLVCRLLLGKKKQ